MFRDDNSVLTTLCLALLVLLGSAGHVAAQEEEMRMSEEAELMTVVTFDEDRMAELAERYEGEELSISDAIRSAGSVELSGGSSELMLVMFHVERGEVTGISRSEPFSMRENTAMSLDDVMYGEERPAVAGSGEASLGGWHAALGGWHLATAGEEPITAEQAMEEPEAMLWSRGVLEMPHEFEEMTGVVVMAVPTGERYLSSTMVQPSGLFAKELPTGDL